ncbi:hypothetical protein GTP41_04235 [Pseudoduganella sp. DS3]|uniref:Lipoprotein n=1 Tax=Pseudoduganella guangdongensis TaxID=2692179 RepID=A0A6N9HCS3_9BURK|nr:hypothetical protein [Pseudoduganella guangdongensis]MYN01304.1 hypothetical protein [Pseudoduganella guangdongensis]
MKRYAVLLALAASACSKDVPQDKLVEIMNQRAPLVAHIGQVTRVDVLSTAKAAAGSRGERHSCEVRLLHVKGTKGATYVSFLRREARADTESAITWADDRHAAAGKMGEMLSSHCNT